MVPFLSAPLILPEDTHECTTKSPAHRHIHQTSTTSGPCTCEGSRKSELEANYSPKDPCTHRVYTRALKLLYRNPFRPKYMLYRVHGSFGYPSKSCRAGGGRYPRPLAVNLNLAFNSRLHSIDPKWTLSSIYAPSCELVSV